MVRGSGAGGSPASRRGALCRRAPCWLTRNDPRVMVQAVWLDVSPVRETTVLLVRSSGDSL